MTEYLSVKLKVTSFLLIIMVVYLHSYNLIVNLNSGTIGFKKGYASFFEAFCTGVESIAVPLFFLISSYLFFRNMTGTRFEFVSKIKKRIKTLLVPYLFWSLWSLVIFFVLQTIPQSKPFFTSELIRDYSLTNLLFRVFIDPFAYQLWFIWDLFILVLLSPFIYWLVKSLKYYFLLALFSAWILNLNFFLFTNMALFFFALGAFIGLEGDRIMEFRFSGKRTLIFNCLWIFLVFSRAFLDYIDAPLFVVDPLHKISILTGLIAFWNAYNVLFQDSDYSQYRFFSIFSFSFFIFAFHEPLLIIIKKGLFYILGANDLFSLIIYILAPVVTITISLLTGSLVKKIMPGFYLLITGGR